MNKETNNAMNIKRKTIAMSLTWLAASLGAMAQDGVVNIEVNSHEADISPNMYGVFFEEINHAGDGGLYAELVQNRSFEDATVPHNYTIEKGKLVSPLGTNHLSNQRYTKTFGWPKDAVNGWRLSDGSAATMTLTKDNPKFATAPTNLRLTVNNTTAPVQLLNDGYWGMGLCKGETYKLRVIVRKGDYMGTVTAKLLDDKGRTLAKAPLSIEGKDWNDINVILKSSATTFKGSLALELDKPGTVSFDYVSLFPEKTFNNQANGMRKDVADVLTALQPKFFRWPGGCVAEGITLDNRFDWKKTMGDPAARSGEYSMWGYRCSYGMGYKEVLDYCEAVGASMLFVCNVGMDCELRLAQVCHADSVKFFLKECLDALDYALGDASTEWGARRIADGHAQPYPLKYVEVGNENWGPIYQERFALFRDAIKERYPQLSIIYNVMNKREKGVTPKTDMVDPHWYKAPEFFFSNTRLFDKWERGKHTVYVGEYACNGNVGGGNMYAALSEAAFIGGMERNGDLVRMASYAPLFENQHDRRWKTNLIWINSEKTVGRSSYYVQKMCAENRPDYNLATDFHPTPIDTLKDCPERKALRTCPLQFVDAGYDKAKGEVVIKVVNASKLPYVRTFRLNGASEVAKQGRVITLAAKSGEEENSFDEPFKISPVETAYKRFSKEFSYTFKPFSYTILRVKTNK